MKTDIETRRIIEKWYVALGFDKKYDCEFYEALESIPVAPSACVENYDLNETDGKKNLLYFLYFCEKAEKAYTELNVPSDIFLNTVHDIVIWTDTWSKLKGELYLGELDWLQYIFDLSIVRIGRLQYRRAYAKHGAPDFNLEIGDPVLEIHIPADGALDNAACICSIEAAEKFFTEFYPDFKFKCFTCHSWLLDTTLSDILKEGSNILLFQKLYSIVELTPSDAIVSYVLGWKLPLEAVPEVECKSGFALAVKKEILAGRAFNVGLGIIKRKTTTD